MIVTMTTDAETRSFDLNTMPIKDAAECERLTGWTWTEWREALASDRAQAVAFAWWMAGKRAGLEVGKFSDIDLDLAKVRWSVDLDESEKPAEDGVEPAEDEAALPTGLGEGETPAA